MTKNMFTGSFLKQLQNLVIQDCPALLTATLQDYGYIFKCVMFRWSNILLKSFVICLIVPLQPESKFQNYTVTVFKSLGFL